MKKSNKGFSLVELIIVIAIMAILIAVLAPQYLKYVEKTKRSTDAKAFGEVVQATEVAIADPLNGFTGDSLDVEWTGTGSTASFTIGDTNIQAEVAGVVNGTNSTSLPAKSKLFPGSSKVTFSITTSDGNWTKTSSGAFSSYVDY